jgi:hypothetical protein
MKVNLQATRLWDIIEFGTSDYRNHRSALAVILHAVPLEMQAGLVVKSMLHKAWEGIGKVLVGMDRVKEVNTERLRQEFGDITFKPGETVEDFWR